MITFGDYPVEIHGPIISCKGVTGTLAQMEEWYNNHEKDKFTKFYFGYGEKQSEIVVDGDQVKIACLQEEYKSFKRKVNKLIHG